MTAEHEIAWTFETGHVRGLLVCHAPPKSDCRLTSVGCDCESGEIKRDPDGTPYHEVEAWDEKAGKITTRRHEMTWQAECNVELFVNQGELEELCEDAFQIGRTLVTPIWEGEYYSWEPAAKGGPT